MRPMINDVPRIKIAAQGVSIIFAGAALGLIIGVAMIHMAIFRPRA